MAIKPLGWPVVYRSPDIANTIKGGVESQGSSLHPQLREFPATIGRVGTDGVVDLEVLIPGFGNPNDGQNHVAPPKHKWVLDVREGEGPGEYRQADLSRLPGFLAIFRVSEEELQISTRNGVETVGCAYHPDMIEFAAVGVHLQRDGRATLELIIPSCRERPGFFSSGRRWVCNVPEGKGPGQFSFLT